MDSEEAKRVLLDLYHGIDPENGMPLQDGHVCKSLQVACALHIAIRAIDGVKIGVSEMERYSPIKHQTTRKRERSGLRKTKSVLGNSGTAWTKEEKALLIWLYERGESCQTMGTELRRTGFEVQEKLEKMGLNPKLE